MPAAMPRPAVRAARRLLPVSVALLAAGLGVASVVAMSAGAQAPARPSTATGEWPTYGGDLASTKYSPLDQITRDNFAALKIGLAAAKSPDDFLSLTLPDGGEWHADFEDRSSTS